MGDSSASMLELKALRVPTGHYDVAILGGGLAGLSMALQLKRDTARTRACWSPTSGPSRLPRPPSRSASRRVEIGAHYYREVVGMRDHLEQEQLRKLGLRFFLPAGDNSDITKRVEFCTPGAPRRLHAPDRPRALRERALPALPQGTAPTPSAAGACRTSRSASDKHTITLSQEDDEATRHGALDRRRERPREHPPPQARPRHRHRPPHQRGLVPARRRPRLRGVGRDDEEWLGPDARARPARASPRPT